MSKTSTEKLDKMIKAEPLPRLKKRSSPIGGFREGRIVLTQKSCVCKNKEFHSYPGDHECACGIDKHHVHCMCGGVTQIG